MSKEKEIEKKVLDGTRFIDGVTAKGKLIGVEDVKEETGDDVCNTSMVKLKAVVLAKKEHKLPILIKVSLDGVSIIDAKTQEVLHKHPVDRISYISRDPTDARAFGYIFKNDKAELQYVAIKTERQSAEVVLTLKDLFEVVFEMRKQKKEEQQPQPTQSYQIQQQTSVVEEPKLQPVLLEQQTSVQQPANIFDLDDSVPAPPPSTAAAVPQIQQQQQNNNNTDLFSLQGSAPSAQPLIKSSSADNILDFLDNSGPSSFPTTNTAAVNVPVAQPPPKPQNSELFTLSLTPDQLSGPDKFAALKSSSSSLSSPMPNTQNPFATAAPRPSPATQAFHTFTPPNSFSLPTQQQFSNPFGGQPQQYAPPPIPPLPNVQIYGQSPYMNQFGGSPMPNYQQQQQPPFQPQQQQQFGAFPGQPQPYMQQQQQNPW